MLEGFANRLQCHRLQPKPAHRLLRTAEFDQVTENQLAFAAGIAGVDQKIDIFALHKPFQHVETRLRFLDRLKLELIGNDREIGETPFTALHIELARQGEFHQVSERRGNEIALIFEMVFHLFEAAERAGDVVRHAWFLGNNR